VEFRKVRNLIFVFALLFLRVAIPAETSQLRICPERTGEPVAKMSIWPPEGEIVMVSNACNSIAVETFGARIVSWKKNGEEMLWMPKVREGRIWNHGGIPVCWPWHGRRSEAGMPIHGLAWAKNFSVVSLSESPSASVLELGCGHDALSLVCRIELTDALKVEMVTKNNGNMPVKVASAIHPYFRIGDIEAASVNGREFHGPFDKGFNCKHGDVYAVVDKVLKRKISVCADKASRFVVWTPWTTMENVSREGIAPLDIGEYRNFIAVEPVSDAWKNAKMLAVGETFTYCASIRVSGL
jgi:glucose-6-phosphate 1-epimerase